MLRTENHNMTLGEHLKRAREASNLSLRAVEERIGISNAFLSQLESGKVKQPSPLILHKLAQLYGIEYETLMDATGYPVPKPQHKIDALVFGRLGKVTVEEETQLADFLSFIRSRQQKGRRQR